MRIVFLVLISISLNLYANIFKKDNVITDSETGIMWQDNSDVETNNMMWKHAVKYCKKLDLDGFDDWYLPSPEELLTITDKSKYGPSIKDDFRYISKGRYWSSYAVTSDESFAWSVDFNDGSTGNSRDKLKEYNVRCSRLLQYNTVHFDKLLARTLKQELNKIPGYESSNITSESEEESAKKSAVERVVHMTWGKPIIYDIEYDKVNHYFNANLSFEANKNFFKKVTIGIEPRNELYFIRDFNSIKPKAIFDYRDDRVVLKDVVVPYRGTFYSTNFIEASSADLVVSANISNKFDESGLEGLNELDNLLAESRKATIDPKKWLFVIGIEDYKYTDNIAYAKRSAELFAKTAQKRLGISEEQSFVLIDSDASKSNIKNNLNQMLKKLKKGDSIYFYYNGYGVLVPQLKNEPFILASDAEPANVSDEKFFSLKNIYSKLSYSKANKVIAFVDSGFSDLTDLSPQKEKKENITRSVRFNKNKMVVLTATNGCQCSNGYDKKAHRLFSYYLIKDIIGGTKHIKGFFKTMQGQIYDTSIAEYGEEKVQEPSINGNLRLSL